jgi:hypothetical protein
MSRAKELLKLLEKELPEDGMGGGLSNGIGAGGIGGLGASNYASVISPGGGISLNNMGRPLASGVGGGAFRKGKIGIISAKYPEPNNTDGKEDNDEKIDKEIKRLKKRGVLNAKDISKLLKSRQNSVKGKRVSFF